ncbi:MAG: TldD/PmbA family protein [Actinobacteria bacterium]|nr:MAG: TldD/PmbA family protein [Actinomycetota bacterium]
MRPIDDSFAALPLDAIADAALTAAAAGAGAAEGGASWCDVRVQVMSERHVQLRDGSPEVTMTSRSAGIGIRVIADGAWGFAATSELTPDAAVACVVRAIGLARSTARLGGPAVELAPEPAHVGTWVSDYDCDPTEVGDGQVLSRLAEWSGTCAGHPAVHHTAAAFSAAKEQLFYADSAGARTRQQRVRCQPEVTAIAVTDGGFEDMRTTLAPRGAGWEYALEPAWDAEVAGLGDHLAQRVAAPALEPGRYDLVIAPSNLWLTIHESVGHATEYDRAVGFEANYAGTSFATPDGLGGLRYGSQLMHVTGDRTVPQGLSTVAWDHEGVAAGRWDLVREGVLVGYQLDRWGAARLGAGASNGCAYADDAGHVQIQRMPNVSLQPAVGGGDLEALVAGVTDGLLVVGDKSWSIDMSRRNFQFTAQRFLRIRNGHLAGQVKDIAYQSDTLDFWAGLVALGGEQTYELGGALNCGKGQPGQVAAVSHGCPAAVFSGVNVLRTASGEAS